MTTSFVRHRAVAGAVAGFVLRLARESIPLTQVAMAEALGVDLNTIQAREAGRRPLANMKAGDVLALRRRLLSLGASQIVLRLLDAAMDADRIIGAAFDAPENVELHPLAEWVHTRQTAHMIAWAVNGTTPPALRAVPAPRRRGPVASAPLLSAGDRAAFFAHLRDIVEHTATDPRHSLLRRQALYLTSYDQTPEADEWTAYALHRRREVLASRGWSARWAEARSTATAMARRGDPMPLLDFIARNIQGDDDAEAANLNYWAYWLGALRDPQPDDAFMANRALTGWDAVTLLRSLTEGLHQAPGYVDLYAHTVWALLEAQKWLPQAVPDLTAALRSRTVVLLEEGRISPRARQKLTTVHYVLGDQH